MSPSQCIKSYSALSIFAKICVLSFVSLHSTNLKLFLSRIRLLGTTMDVKTGNRELEVNLKWRGLVNMIKHFFYVSRSFQMILCFQMLLFFILCIMVKKMVKKGWKKLSQNYRKSVEYSRIFSAGFIVYIGKVQNSRIFSVFLE